MVFMVKLTRNEKREEKNKLKERERKCEVKKNKNYSGSLESSP